MNNNNKVNRTIKLFYRNQLHSNHKLDKNYKKLNIQIEIA